MGRFGKKVSISLNPLDYNITILGESGIGKTTLAKEMCEKLVGDEGYIHFDIGNEDGAAAIEGIVSEKIEDWAKLSEVRDDIVENKDSDYKNLKVIIWDTLDELILLAEAESLRQYNKKNPDKKADTISAAWGGFMKGQDKAAEFIIDMLSSLRAVGISNIIIGHVKRSDITDPITQETYSKITADTTQRYFNVIKNKQHFVALAYIDRDIVKEKTGKKNVVTKQDITINKAVSESRVISFRDDTYSVDSKSRFADIVDRVSFDTDEFIKAMTDAIEKEKTKKGISLDDAKKEQKEKDKEKATKASEASKSAKENKVDSERNAELIEELTELFSKADAEKKAAFKEIKAEKAPEAKNFKDMIDIPTSVLEGFKKFLS